MRQQFLWNCPVQTVVTQQFLSPRPVQLMSCACCHSFPCLAQFKLLNRWFKSAFEDEKPYRTSSSLDICRCNHHRDHKIGRKRSKNTNMIVDLFACAVSAFRYRPGYIWSWLGPILAGANLASRLASTI